MCWGGWRGVALDPLEAVFRYGLAIPKMGPGDLCNAIEKNRGETLERPNAARYAKLQRHLAQWGPIKAG
jgi:hypothetical protein